MCTNYRRVTSLGRLLTFFGVERHRDCLGIEAGAHHNLAMKAQSGRRGLEAAEQLQLVGRGECFGLQLCTATTGFDASLTLTIAMPMTTTTISSINRTVVERIVEVCSASTLQIHTPMRSWEMRLLGFLKLTGTPGPDTAFPAFSFAAHLSLGARSTFTP
jgi:hypothetical protein